MKFPPISGGFATLRHATLSLSSVVIARHRPSNSLRRAVPLFRFYARYVRSKIAGFLPSERLYPRPGLVRQLVVPDAPVSAFVVVMAPRAERHEVPWLERMLQPKRAAAEHDGSVGRPSDGRRRGIGRAGAT